MTEDRGKVRFIRKGGRIIPIRAKKRTHGDKVKTGGKIAAAGLAINVASVKGYLSQAKKEPKMRKSDIRRARKLTGKKWKLRTDDLGGSYIDTIKRKVNISAGAGRYTLDHEVGHVMASKRRFSANRATFKVERSIGASISKVMRGMEKPKSHWGKSKNRNTAKLFGKAMSYRAIKPYSTLAIEAEATGRAFKMIKRREGWKGVRRASKVLLPAYGTYAGKALLAGGLTYAGYHGAKALFGNKKRRK